MKKITLLVCCLVYGISFSQDHYAGLTTSKRVGILNGNMNPSEFANLNSRFEIHIIGFSANQANNKVKFSDLVDGNDIESILFTGNENVNYSIDGEITWPSFAFRFQKWGFGLASKTNIKANVINLDPELGNALLNDDENIETYINNDSNQRVNATVWSEIGVSVARNIFENDKNRINVGATFKLLFPGAYANMGLRQFGGDINQFGDQLLLNNAQGNLNIAYSDSFGESFSETSDYTSAIFKNLNGLATDIGIDYQLKNDSGYKLKIGASVKNIGSMTFKGENVSNNYALNIDDPNPNGGLDLNEFEDVEGFDDIEDKLAEYPNYFTKTESTGKDIKVKLPTVFNLYADIKIISKFSLTLHTQQRLGDLEADDQITSQNSFAIIPRVNIGFFEAYVPIVNNEISGTVAGVGFRLGGFFIGSNSIVTALTSDSKQIDLHFGSRFGFL